MGRVETEGTGMTKFARSYPTGRRVTALVAVIGWLVAVSGVVVIALGGLALLGAAEAGPQVVTIATGLAILLAGLLGVAGAQHMRAGFDVADMTREMLAIARRGAIRAPAETPPRKPVAVEPLVAATGDAPAPPAPPRPRLAGSPKPVRTEPRLGGASRSGEGARTIFSAKPPA